MQAKLYLLAAIAAIIGTGWWLVSRMFNLPGEAVADQGREHWKREELEKFVYNSNPPTSGPHDPNWIRPGVYDTPQDKYKLIHSLEHGYIVVHYNCAISNPKSQAPNPKKFSIFSSQFSISAMAHEDEGDADGDSTPSAGLNFGCSLGQVLADWTKQAGLKRLIVQPNPEIDSPVVLTAWGRMLKMESWNEKAATRFAKAYHNKGPEQTME